MSSPFVAVTQKVLPMHRPCSCQVGKGKRRFALAACIEGNCEQHSVSVIAQLCMRSAHVAPFSNDVGGQTCKRDMLSTWNGVLVCQLGNLTRPSEVINVMTCGVSIT